MGTVYHAEETTLYRKVALKVLNPLLTSDPQFVERFKNEAKVQAGLKNENLISLQTFYSRRSQPGRDGLTLYPSLLPTQSGLRLPSLHPAPDPVGITSSPLSHFFSYLA
ncbi:MAG: hypothetical protein IAE91_04475 [Ignavibacteriaceae bacterium]|nr:hypothetical protein [Ignavibacteriaceae bacterium]